jgi:PPK2 family polyphosphate:nucleotide phosphotransferase
MAAIRSKDFRAREDHRVDLGKWPTRVSPSYSSKDDYRNQLQTHVDALTKLQSKLYASNQYALLLIFQGMDTAGKDGVIKHVMSGVNPQGCQTHSFKHPGPEQLAHDFLWAAVQHLPERGHIGIFNRSYYEEVLILRVHPGILRAENLPQADHKDIWEHRYRSIVDLERHLHHNGTRIVKFFLHLSKEEQRKRLLARIDDPDKNWKLSVDDVKERGFWKNYMHAYEACLSATSTDRSPWYIVPADDKPNAQLIVSQIVLETLGKLKIGYPRSSKEHRSELEAVRRSLEKQSR